MSSGTNFPYEVNVLLKNNRYADAIEVCKQKSFIYSSIVEKVKEIVEQANLELDREKNPSKSIELYIQTIGIIEPSNVLCRFFSPHLTRYLTKYLVELHTRGYAKEADTRLLFNLFHHSEERESLSAFIKNLKNSKEDIENFMTKGPSLGPSSIIKKLKKDAVEEALKQKFDREAKQRFIQTFKPIAAVETLVDNDMNEPALSISQIFGVSKQIIDLMINTDYKDDREKVQNYSKAAEMINNKIDDPEGRSLLLEFGPKLLRGDEVTAKLVENTAYQLWMDESEHDDAAFLKLFWGCPQRCRCFLETAIQNKATPLFVNAYIELLIPDNYFFKDHFIDEASNRSLRYLSQETATDSVKALKFIQDSSIPIDDINPLLYICTELKFAKGIIELLKRKNRVSDITAIYIANCMTSDLVKWVNSNPDLDGEDWVSILRYFAAVPNKGESFDQDRIKMVTNNEFMKKLVEKAKKARPLFSLIQELSANPNIQFDVIMKDLNTELSGVISQLELAESTHRDRVDELRQLDEEIAKLEENDFEFKPKYCDKCSTKLTVPFVGFFCGHNMHQLCCEQRDGELICPICSAGKGGVLAGGSALASDEASPELSISNTTTDLIDTTVKMIEGGFYSLESY